MTLPHIPMIARVIAVLLLGAALVIVVRDTGRDAREDTGLANSAATDASALKARLAHCQRLGLAAAEDAGCVAAWAENRKGFFGDEAAR